MSTWVSPDSVCPHMGQLTLDGVWVWVVGTGPAVPGGRGSWRCFIALAGGVWWRGSEAGDLWKSSHLSCCALAPRGAALPLPCAVVAAGSWEVFPRFGCSSVQSQMETSRNPAGTLCPQQEQPLPTPPPSPHGAARAAGALPRAPRTGWAILKRSEIPPKPEFDRKAIPKHGSWARSTTGVQSHPPCRERARPWLLGQPENVLK